ncbi:hypothetical protein COLO4_04016 [Corchorus olitorius]|uniref:Uncharacterized protein n=1 Tax=Corchorus olitorius TaxID=93759 RepID=A0A1R3KVQ0_9ROSI|nr:hypothetical protein COLO4_04016 [Corchorus olitorius]
MQHEWVRVFQELVYSAKFLEIKKAELYVVTAQYLLLSAPTPSYTIKEMTFVICLDIIRDDVYAIIDFDLSLLFNGVNLSFAAYVLKEDGRLNHNNDLLRKHSGVVVRRHEDASKVIWIDWVKDFFYDLSNVAQQMRHSFMATLLAPASEWYHWDIGMKLRGALRKDVISRGLDGSIIYYGAVKFVVKMPATHTFHYLKGKNLKMQWWRAHRAKVGQLVVKYPNNIDSTHSILEIVV